MPICDLCGKDFKGLEKHKLRKTPCRKEPVAFTSEFCESSKNFHVSISKKVRQEQGIYFTPKKVREILFAKLAELGVKPKTILEPSFGTGEFLLDSKRIYPEAKLFGVEKNKDLFQSVQCPEATLTQGDFLEWKGNAELILGNPPYFVIKTDHLTTKQKKEFMIKHAEAMTGRPNMYVLFLYKCLEEHLEPGGTLAFILPTSFYNCSYYQPLRNYIQKHTTILHVENLDKPGFYDTGQDTMLLILQKKKTNEDYLFHSKSGNLYISPYYKELYAITKDTRLLTDLGLGAKTGNVVWNQIKEKLSTDKGTLLIYSSNIKEGVLELDNLGGEKKQYVKESTKPTLSGPLILVDRGYGNSYRFNSIRVELNDFYAENHINVIYPKTPEVSKNLDVVLKSFKDERTHQFIKWFIGNGAISATDLETILPIF